MTFSNLTSSDSVKDQPISKMNEKCLLIIQRNWKRTRSSLFHHADLILSAWPNSYKAGTESLNIPPKIDEGIAHTIRLSKRLKMII